MLHRLLRQTLLFTFVLSLFAIQIPASYAQYQYATGCYADFQPKLSATTDEFDFDAMCDVYKTCSDEDGTKGCEFKAFETAFIPCEGIDSCEINAAIYTSLITMFDHPDLAYGLILEDLPIDEVTEALNLMDVGEYGSALAIVEPLAETYEHPMIMLMIGYLYGEMGESETAFEYYTKGIDLNITEPLLYFLRSRESFLLEDMNQSILDLHMFYSLISQTDTPEIQGLLAELFSEFELDTIFEKETLMLYPFQSISENPGGTVVTDLSAEAATEVNLYHIDDETILIENIPLTDFYFGAYVDYVLMPSMMSFTLDETGQYTQSAIVLHAENYKLNISIQPDEATGNYMMTWESLGFESGGTKEFILAPSDQPDPRQ